MIINETGFDGVLEIITLPLEDNRGYFARTFDKIIFKENGLDFDWLQENKSYTLRSGTIRGLHFQFPPFSETKLISVSKGKILDIILDLRTGSDTFGMHYSTYLSDSNNKALIVPRGFAHGFCTLKDETEVLYKVDNVYSSENECGILWNDSSLAINWPVTDPIISNKDTKLFTFDDFIKKYGSIDKV